MANYSYYNPYGYQNYLPYQQQQVQPMQPIQQQQPVVHHTGIITVQSEQEARNYPVAPSTSVTFHNENEPYIYTKTAGASFDQPKFEKFKLVKEEAEVAAETAPTEYATKQDLLTIQKQIEELQKVNTTTEVTEDE